MKKIFFILLLSIKVISGYTQGMSNAGSVLQDVNGKPILSNNYVEIEGNPYLPEQWTVGSIKLKNGAVINYNALRYNMASGELEFQRNDQAFILTNPFDEFTLINATFRKGFPAIDGQSNNSFYEVLHDGKLKLLCFKNAVMYEEKPYNSATKIKKFLHNTYYYLYKTDGTMVKVKKDKKAILAILSDKSSQLEEYFKKENIKIKEWSDVANVLAYYEKL